MRNICREQNKCCNECEWSVSTWDIIPDISCDYWAIRNMAKRFFRRWLVEELKTCGTCYYGEEAVCCHPTNSTGEITTDYVCSLWKAERDA